MFGLHLVLVIQHVMWFMIGIENCDKQNLWQQMQYLVWLLTNTNTKVGFPHVSFSSGRTPF